MSVQCRNVTDQRVALRLAQQVPVSNSIECIEEMAGTSKNHLPLKIIHADIENVPLSPVMSVANISDVVKSLPKCLMHTDGTVFD